MTLSYRELLYVRRRFIQQVALRAAIAQVVNATFAVRRPDIWGEGTTACASDAKKFGAWDQNLMTEWHIRYGGRGVMIYWHVEKKAACIYSQLKRCSSSEVAAMIEGVLRHYTTMEIEQQYVDSYGQSEVAFAFCYLLGGVSVDRLYGCGHIIVQNSEKRRLSLIASSGYASIPPRWNALARCCGGRRNQCPRTRLAPLHDSSSPVTLLRIKTPELTMKRSAPS